MMIRVFTAIPLDQKHAVHARPTLLLVYQILSSYQSRAREEDVAAIGALSISLYQYILQPLIYSIWNKILLL